MTQAYRGPIALTLAGILLVCAVVSCLIGDLESNARRHEAAQLDQEIRRDYRAWSLDIHVQIEQQRASIADTRRRLDDLTRRLGVMHEELEKLKGSQLRQTPLHQSAAGLSPMASGN
jgi:hypothetical protein